MLSLLLLVITAHAQSVSFNQVSGYDGGHSTDRVECREPIRGDFVMHSSRDQYVGYASKWLEKARANGWSLGFGMNRCEELLGNKKSPENLVVPLGSKLL